MRSIQFKLGSFSPRVISGWAFDEGNIDESVSINLYVDDELIGDILCNLPRSNVPLIPTRRAKIGFATSLPLKYWDGAPHKVVLKDPVTDAVLSDKLLKTQNVQILAETSDKIFGEIDVVDSDRVAGWVLRGERPVELNIYIDEILVDSLTADLPEAIDAEYRCGFSSVIPRIWRDGEVHSVRVSLNKENSEINLSAFEKLLEKSSESPVELRLSLPVPFVLHGFLHGAEDRIGAYLQIFEKSVQIGRAEIIWDESAPHVEIDLRKLPNIDWMNADLSFRLGERPVIVSYAGGGHPVRDQVQVRMGDDAASIRLETFAPLPAQAITLSSGSQLFSDAIVQGDAHDPGVLHVRHPALTALSADELTLVVSGWEYPVETGAALELEPLRDGRSAQPGRVDLSTFQAPTSVDVRRTLAGTGKGPGEADASAGHFTGEWWFSSPTDISGWAASLAVPDQALAVELLSDDIVVATTIANAAIKLPDLGIARAVPLGFSFDLGRLTPGRTCVSIRVGRSARLPPVEGVSIEIPQREAAGDVVEAIDHCVQRGDLISAYVKCGEEAGRRSADVAARRMVLTLATHLSGLHAAGLDVLGEAVGRKQLVEALSELTTFNPEADDFERLSLEDRVREELGRLNLPSVYGSLALGKRRGKPAERVLRAHLLSSEQYLKGDSLCPYASISIVLAPMSSESAAFVAHLDELERLGCRVSRLKRPLDGTADLPPSAPAQARRRRKGAAMAPPDAEAAQILVIYLAAERILSVETLPHWHRAIVNSRGNAELTMIEAGADVGDHEAIVLPRRIDPDIQIWFRPTEGAEFSAVRASRRVLERPAVELTTLSAALRPSPPFHFVISCGLSAVATPRIPNGVEVVEISMPAAGEEGAAWLTLALLDQLEARAARSDASIIVLSDQFKYSPSYVADCLRERTIEVGRSVVLTAIGYSTEKQEFSVIQEHKDDVSYLGLLCRGCYSLSELRAFVECHGAAAESTIVLAQESPFKVASASDPTELESNIDVLRYLLRNAKKDEGTCHLGFLSDALLRVGHRIPRSDGRGGLVPLDRQEGLSWRLLQRKEELAAADSLKGLSALTSQLASVGFDLEAAGLLRGRLAQAVSARKGTEGDYLEILQAAKSLGMLGEVAVALADRAPALVTAFPGLITPLFEALALALSPEDFSAVIVASTAAALQGSATRPIFRLVELGRRYSSALTMVTILAMIGRSAHVEMLKSKAIQAAAGYSFLMNGFTADVEFPEAGTSVRAMKEAAPLRLQAVAALDADDPHQFIAVLRKALLSDSETAELVAALRVYSYELSLFSRKYGVMLPSGSVAENTMILGILLEDERFMRYLSDQGGVGGSDTLSIVASTYTGDYAMLNRTYARWADEAGLLPVTFGGGSVTEMFGGFAAEYEGQRKTLSLGKVSVLLTVYNPDIALMRLAVKSVLNQTYDDLEIIIVDDASDELGGDLRAALDIDDHRLKFLKMPRNSGPYVCRNLALQSAEGEFVAIQDADDFSHPQRIETQVRLLAERPTRMMCTTEHMRIDLLGRLQFEHTFDIRGDGPMTTLFRRSCFDVLGPFASVRSRGDVEFRERVRAAFGLHSHVKVNFPMVFCYAAPSSLSNTTVRKMPEYLRLFRESFDKRTVLPVIDGMYTGQRPPAVEVPFVLRP